MLTLPEREVFCPYCGERITVLVDTSVDHQSYIEDCSVCCRPINLNVVLNTEGELDITLSRDDE